MKSSTRDLLLHGTLIIVGLCAFFWGLVMAQAYLVPITVAGLLAMLVLPMSNWMERKGMNRVLAALCATLVLLALCVAFVGVLGLQVRSFASDWPEIKQEIMPQLEKLQEEITARTGLTVKEQNEQIGLDLNNEGAHASPEEDGSEVEEADEAEEEQPAHAAAAREGTDRGQGSQAGSMVDAARTFVMGFLGFMVSFILVFVYIFFFLLYRHKLSNTILKLVPEDQRGRTRRTITEAAAISQKYLMGRLILIVCLTVLYSTGLLISGVEHAIIISLLAAILSLLPFVGNFIGAFLALIMAFVSGVEPMGIVGVVITFAVAQVVETYVLQPFILGDKLDLSPIMVIMVVVLGEAVWGLAGLAVAIPLLGIVKVICDRVPVLEPLGYLLGQDKKKE
jgi:predicted PurR-regulated permease PerM